MCPSYIPFNQLRIPTEGTSGDLKQFFRIFMPEQFVRSLSLGKRIPPSSPIVPNRTDQHQLGWVRENVDIFLCQVSRYFPSEHTLSNSFHCTLKDWDQFRSSQLYGVDASGPYVAR